MGELQEVLYFGMRKLQSELFLEHFHRKQLGELGRGSLIMQLEEPKTTAA